MILLREDNMCKKCNKFHLNNNRKDICMAKLCSLMNETTKYKTLASCCGHGKYPMTIVVSRGWGDPIEWFSQITIKRKRNFYKRDKQGIFYIPELIK